MRWDDDGLRFAPRLPPGLRRLAFTLGHRDRCLHVEITSQRATYRLRSGPPLTLRHHGTELTVGVDAPVEGRVPVPAPRRSPEQPPHRRPRPR
nr:glycosyl hydrolase family 65 protein [Actinospica acidiphila]